MPNTFLADEKHRRLAQVAEYIGTHPGLKTPDLIQQLMIQPGLSAAKPSTIEGYLWTLYNEGSIYQPNGGGWVLTQKLEEDLRSQKHQEETQ